MNQSVTNLGNVSSRKLETRQVSLSAKGVRILRQFIASLLAVNIVSFLALVLCSGAFAQSKSADVNELFVQALKTHRLAKEQVGEKRAQSLLQVLQLFGQVSAQYPDHRLTGLIKNQAIPNVDFGELAPVGWNEGKRGIARDLLAAFNNDLDTMRSVGDAAIFALLSAATYGHEDGQKAKARARELGWIEVDIPAANSFIVGGAKASLFNKGNRAVLAFRGSTTTGDWITNAGTMVPVPLAGEQVIDAISLAVTLSENYSNLILTGHSLGGRLAQASRRVIDRPTYVFNSAPVGLPELSVLGVANLISNPKTDLQRFRHPQDQLSGIFPANDVEVKNIYKASVILTLIEDGVSGYGDATKKYFHDIDVLSQAMQSVRQAHDLGWLSAYLVGLPLPDDSDVAEAGDRNVEVGQSASMQFLSGEIPILKGVYVRGPKLCQVTSETERYENWEKIAIVGDNSYDNWSAKCSIHGAERFDGVTKIQATCDGEGMTSDVTWTWNVEADDRFLQYGNGSEKVWTRCSPKSPLAQFHADETKEETTPSSVQIAGQSCTPATSPASRDTLLTWVSKPINGRTASGASWSLDLWSLTTKEVGPAVFTNSKDEKTTGIWKPLEGKICQSYNNGASWACYDILKCSNLADSTYVLKNAEGELSSLITTSVGTSSTKTETGAKASIDPSPTDWRSKDDVEVVLDWVEKNYKPFKWKGCERSYGPIHPKDRRRLLEGTTLTVQSGQRVEKKPVSDQLLDGDRFCIGTSAECAVSDMQMFYCGSGETVFWSGGTLTTKLYQITNVERNVTALDPLVTTTITGEIYGRNLPDIRSEGTACALSNGWSEATGFRWDGACESGRASGIGTIHWMKGPEVIGRTRVGPNWGIALSDGVLRYDIDLAAFDFSLASCDQGVSGYRSVKVKTPAGTQRAYFENSWVVQELMRRGALFAQAQCPVDRKKLSNVTVAIEMNGKQVVRGRNYEKDDLTWREFGNPVSSAMQKELQRAERNRIANERLRLAKARADALVAEFRHRRDTIVDRAEDFISSGRGTIDDLAAALELDQSKTRNRLERGATLRLRPVKELATVTYEGQPHYRVNHVISSPFGMLEQEFRSKQDFSWENWMSLTQSDMFERTEIDCLFERVADVPGEVRDVGVELLAFLRGNSSTVISFSCE